MTRSQFKIACESALEEAKNSGVIPVDTDNMRRNAIKYEWIGDTFRIYVDEDIAPYVFFTNETWLSPRWKGKRNPNEDWWERFRDKFMQILAVKLKGEVKR